MVPDGVFVEVGRVVVGVDGSASARQAAMWAAREADTRDVPLTVLHALGRTEGIAPAESDRTPREPTGRYARRRSRGRHDCLAGV